MTQIAPPQCMSPSPSRVRNLIEGGARSNSRRRREETICSYCAEDEEKMGKFGSFWEIEGGKLGRMLRNPTYQGRTPDFWGSCDAICGPQHWDLWGVSNCGKGNPMQVAEMSHGAAPARFRGLNLVGAE